MLYSVCCSARRRKERLPLSATSPSSQPSTRLASAPLFSVSGVYPDLVGASNAIFLCHLPQTHFPPKSFRLNLFPDPHPVNPVVSYRYKTRGGGAFLVLQTFNLQLSTFDLFHSSPLCSSSYTLFSATGFPQLFWNQFLAHSFHRDGGVPPSRSLSPSIGPLFPYTPNSFRMRSSKNLSSRLSLTSLQSISISARVAPKSFRMRSSTHFSPNSFRMRRSKKRWGGGVYGSTGRPASTPRPNDIAGKDLMLRDGGCNSLPSSFEHGAVFDALHKLHLDFGLLVGHAIGGFRRHDQRLRAIGQVEGTLKLQR